MEKTIRSLPVLLVLAWVLSGCQLSGASGASATSTTGSATPTAVPWLDKPATVPATTVVTSPISPACKPADLHVGTVSSGLATAQEGWRVPITNTGSRPCSLPGYPSTITAIGPDGNRVTLSNEPMMQPAPPITIPRAGKVTLQVVSSALCNPTGTVEPSRHYSSVEVDIPTGTLDLANLNLTLCANKIFSGFQPISAPAPVPGTVASLTAHLDIPRTVNSGSTLKYQVVLVNNSPRTVDLKPCPVYQEAITVFTGTKGRSRSRTLELDCTSVKAIKPAHKITYQMVISVPPLQPGPAKFAWSIAPGGPFAGTALTIVR